MNGYDGFLAREWDRHCARVIDQDALEAEVERQANKIGGNAERFMAWLEEYNWKLSEVTIKSSVTGKNVNARTALVAHAPAWLRELILDADLVDDEMLREMEVEFANGNHCPADEALIELAPDWLKDELVGWLSRTSQLKNYVNQPEAV